MNRRHRKYLSACLPILGSVVALHSAAQNLSRVPPEKVKQISASLDKSLLPKGANNFEVERNQVVAAPGITFVPVRYQASYKIEGEVMDGPPPTKFFCGLYQLADGASAKFLVVFGVGKTELEGCDGLKAIGAVTPHASHGDLILIYDAYTLREDFPASVILSWNEAQKQYLVNDYLTDYVGNSTNGFTILNIRSLLAPLAAKP
jgi:hypothetical protein